MSTTPISSKPQLSKGLKDRLKKCGRYHASPIAASRTETTASLPLDTVLTPGSPCSKRMRGLCDITQTKDTDESSGKSLTDVTNMTDGTQILTGFHRSNTENTSSLADSANTELQHTPLSQRSRSNAIKGKGSKLCFQEKCDKSTESASTHQSASDSADVSNKETSIHSKSLEKVALPRSHEMTRSEDVMSRSQLLKEISKKEEELRKLQMVKMYRSKNNLSELQTLIDKWREVSQLALQDLHSAMPEPRPTLTELINHLGIDHELVHFQTKDEEETFY